MDPPYKRSKSEDLSLNFLCRAKVSDLQSPSPGCFFGCRVAACPNEFTQQSSTKRQYSCFVVNAQYLYSLNLSLQNCNEAISRGKSDVYIPHQIDLSCNQNKVECERVEGVQTRSEIQSVDLRMVGEDRLRVGCVDQYGFAVLIEVQAYGNYSKPLNIFNLGSQDPMAEAGWAGIAVAENRCAVARHYSKQVYVCEGELLIRQIPLRSVPYAVTFFAEQDLFCVCEGCELSVWDVRSKGVVQRLNSSSAQAFNQLYCVSIGKGIQSNLVAAGGSDRSAGVWDMRTWKQMCRQSGCLKYEITNINLSQEIDQGWFLSGMDYQVVCGKWNQKQTSCEASFRCDTAWLGIDAAPNADVLMGLTTSGTLYVADVH